MTSFHPIQDQRLSDKIVTQIVQAMQSGELTVGTRLPPEAQLAEQLGVSRGILREALTVLEAHGYLRRAPRGGTVITSVLGDDLARDLSRQLRQATYNDLLEFREVMECRAVENIVRGATDEEIRELEGLLQDETLSGSQPDRYFHYQIAELSGNSLFSSFINTYYDLIQEIKVRSVQTPERRAAIGQEHRAILDALEARDSARARIAVRAHLEAVRRSLENNG